jgi:excisionase family DNA binding protein
VPIPSPAVKQSIPQLLTIEQAAESLSVHPNTIIGWERDGLFPAFRRIGSSRRRVLLDDLQAYVRGEWKAKPTDSEVSDGQ